jgi:hypothetical protein
MKMTLPVGVAVPGGTELTVAVRVTARPVTAGLTDDARATVVAAVDGLRHGRRGAVGEAESAGAREGGRQRVVADA